MRHLIMGAMRWLIAMATGIALSYPVHGQVSGEEKLLAKRALASALTDPLSDLSKMEVEGGYGENIGPGDGEEWTLGFFPTLPLIYNENFAIVSHTEIRLVDQKDIFYQGDGGQEGIQDIVQGIFFIPRKWALNGWNWGAGPVMLLPIGSEDELTTDKWGADPTAVVVKQSEPWTFLRIFGHIESFAGDADKPDVSVTFLEPSVAYETEDFWTFTVGSDLLLYDWESEEWSVPWEPGQQSYSQSANRK